MREIRQSGSVGGEPQSNAASLPLLSVGVTKSPGCDYFFPAIVRDLFLEFTAILDHDL